MNRIMTWWHSVWHMDAREYDRLNPPTQMTMDRSGNMFELILDGDWIRMGHIPIRKTRLGEFFLAVAHGLLMRYRLLPVLWWSFRFAFAEQLLPSVTMDQELPDTQDYVYIENEQELCERFTKEDLAGFVLALEAQHRQTLSDVLERIETKRLKVLSNPGDPSWTEHFAELKDEVGREFFTGMSLNEVEQKIRTGTLSVLVGKE